MPMFWELFFTQFQGCVKNNKWNHKANSWLKSVQKYVRMKPTMFQGCIVGLPIGNDDQYNSNKEDGI